MILVLAGLVFVVFGQITFNDGMVARYTDAGWRARVYALRYLLSFGVAAAAIPLVAVMHAHGGFAALFRVLAICGALVTLGALFFPYRRDELAPAVPIAGGAPPRNSRHVADLPKFTAVEARGRRPAAPPAEPAESYGNAMGTGAVSRIESVSTARG